MRAGDGDAARRLALFHIGLDTAMELSTRRDLRQMSHAKSPERVAAAIFVTLSINSSSNMHAYTRHDLPQQKPREHPFRTSLKNNVCLTDISSHRSFKL